MMEHDSLRRVRRMERFEGGLEIEKPAEEPISVPDEGTSAQSGMANEQTNAQLPDEQNADKDPVTVTEYDLTSFTPTTKARPRRSSSDTRISQAQLGEIDLRLSDTDRQLLRTLKQLRYLRTNQVQRLFFSDAPRTPRATLTVTTRALNRLMGYGLINHLPRQIGGTGHGSKGKVWHLTEAGMRLLEFGMETDGKRKRPNEPSSMFLRHILAVAECYVQIIDICKDEVNLRVKALETEPGCWRAYEKAAKEQSLRPDLYAEILNGRYDDRWFIEMDLATEDVGAIVEKCQRYHDYYHTGNEQRAAAGQFPIVLWIVPTEERKQKMLEAIRINFAHKAIRLFIVITPEDLHRTLRDGVRKEDLC